MTKKAVRVTDERLKALHACMKAISELAESEKLWVIKSLVELTKLPLVDKKDE